MWPRRAKGVVAMLSAEGTDIAGPGAARLAVRDRASALRGQRAAMRMAGFKKGWTNRKRCKAIKRDGTPAGG
jgi:hypothetical protein